MRPRARRPDSQCIDGLIKLTKKHIHLQCQNKSTVSGSNLSFTLQVIAGSAECSARSSWADQAQAKQQLVTEAGQRGCWDTQRLNRQPAGHPLFFSSPYTQHITLDPSQASLKEHSKRRVAHYHHKATKKLWSRQRQLVNNCWENINSLISFDLVNSFISHLQMIFHLFLLLLYDTQWTR